MYIYIYMYIYTYILARARDLVEQCAVGTMDSMGCGSCEVKLAESTLVLAWPRLGLPSQTGLAWPRQ